MLSRFGTERALQSIGRPAACLPARLLPTPVKVLDRYR